MENDIIMTSSWHHIGVSCISKFHDNCVNAFGLWSGEILNPPGPRTPKKHRRHRVQLASLENENLTWLVNYES